MNLNTWNYLLRRMLTSLGNVANTSFNILKTTFNNPTEQTGVARSTTAIVGVDRIGYNGDVQVTISGLPAGLTIANTTIAAGQSTAPVAYNFDGTTPAGSYDVTATYTGGSIVKTWLITFVVTP
ncbi:MAG: hypothetical protein AB7G44_07100 [Bacteroidia bacterium]